MSTSDLKDLRESDDPRTNPEAPYTEGWEHLAEKWPEETGLLERYVVLWKEARGVAHWLVECRGSVSDLTTARKWAQEVSIQDATSGELAWVLFEGAGRDEEPETVDVWTGGFWLPPSHWTKEGVPPHPPGHDASRPDSKTSGR